MRAIFFDAFGTLCEILNKRNPYTPIIKAWPTGVADAYQNIMTRDVSPASLALELGCSEKIIQRLEEGIQAEITSMSLYPEVPAVLETLKKRGLKWAIVSNLATPYAKPLLDLLPFPPDAVAWSFKAGHRKPEKNIYLQACKALGVEPSSVLMVGDSLKNDYHMPRQLGMQARYLKRAGTDENKPDWVADLTEILG